jgi:hypothetical protein
MLVWRAWPDPASKADSAVLARRAGAHEDRTVGREPHPQRGVAAAGVVAPERNSASHAGSGWGRPGFAPQCFQHDDGLRLIHHLAGEERVAIAYGVVEAVRDRVAAEFARD